MSERAFNLEAVIAAAVTYAAGEEPHDDGGPRS